MFLIDDFKPVTLDVKILFQQHYQKYPTEHSDNLFTTLTSWNDYGKFRYYFIYDNLLLLSQIKGEIQLRFVSVQLFLLIRLQKIGYWKIILN